MIAVGFLADLPILETTLPHERLLRFPLARRAQRASLTPSRRVCPPRLGRIPQISFPRSVSAKVHAHAGTGTELAA
jgi:hypothetical protein